MNGGRQTQDGEAPADGETPADGEAPVDGEAPADGETPAGDVAAMEFNGEEQTITVTEDTVITKGMGDDSTECTVSDIAADDVLQIVTEDDVVVSIVVME